MKTNHLKKLFLTGLLSLTLLTAAGCGDGTAAEEPELTSPAEDVTDTDDTTADCDTGEEAETKEPETPDDVTVTMDEFYGDTRCAVHLLGLQEYETLEGETYTDTPEEGLQYLVLFLQIENRTESEDYFNTELLDATLDGEAITNTFLINDPENYSTIFTNIPGESTANGFIVWQVPEDWNTLALTYRGWEGSGNVIVHATLTRGDLKAPPAIDEIE